MGGELWASRGGGTGASPPSMRRPLEWAKYKPIGTTVDISFERTGERGKEPKKEFRKKQHHIHCIVWQFYTRDNSFRMKRSSAFVLGFTSIPKTLQRKHFKNVPFQSLDPTSCVKNFVKSQASCLIETVIFHTQH